MTPNVICGSDWRTVITPDVEYVGCGKLCIYFYQYKDGLCTGTCEFHKYKDIQMTLYDIKLVTYEEYMIASVITT